MVASVVLHALLRCSLLRVLGLVVRYAAFQFAIIGLVLRSLLQHGISLLAYSLGSAMGGLLEDLRRYQLYLLGALLVLLALTWLYRRLQRRAG